MVAYVRACFDLVNGCEDKEALGEYDRAEQGFVKALYTFSFIPKFSKNYIRYIK